MKILVTGATGFLGSVLTRQLVEEGADVRILRRASSKLDLLGDIAHHTEQVIGDVTVPDSLTAALSDVQQVYHTAAYLGFGGKRDHAPLHQINVQGTANVVDAALAAGVNRLVHTSSIAALGRPENTEDVLNETATWQPSRFNTQYAVSKYKAELEVYRSLAEGLDAVIVNPSLIFGPNRRGENTQKVVENVRDGKIPAIPTGGTNVVDVEDVAAGHRRAMQHGQIGERYLLSGENLSWRTLIQTFAEAMGVAPPRFTIQYRAALLLGTLSETVAFFTRTRPLITRETARMSARFYRYDNRKAIEVLGCHFRPFQDTVQRVATYLRA